METLRIIGASTGVDYSIAELVRSLNYETLKGLLPIVQAELDFKNPENIKRRLEEEKFWAEYREKRAEKDNAANLAYQSLKRVVAPGTLLKMKGCKDGQGLREFIRWDGQNLVCWQIKYHRVWNPVAKRRVEEFANTNIVTTHMPDKVSGVFAKSSGLLVPMKNILGGAVPA